jgi:hypothetical protein
LYVVLPRPLPGNRVDSPYSLETLEVVVASLLVIKYISLEFKIQYTAYAEMLNLLLEDGAPRCQKQKWMSLRDESGDLKVSTTRLQVGNSQPCSGGRNHMGTLRILGMICEVAAVPREAA